MTHPHPRRLWLAALALALAALALTAAPGRATTSPAPAWPEVLTLGQAAEYLQMPPAELVALAEADAVPARRLGAGWRFSRDALQGWLIGDWRLVTVALAPGDQRGDKRGARPVDPAAMAAVTGAGLGAGLSTSAAGATEAGAAPETIGEAQEERTADEVFLRGQRVLLAPGDVVLDLGLFYSSSDSQQLALAGNGIGLATLERDTFTASALARFGLFQETEVFVGTTYRFQDTDLVLGGETLDSASRDEFGDVRLGVRRTLLHEGPGRPDVIATIEGRIPTESSSFALGGGLSFVKSYDPAVLFGSASYLHTFSRDFDDVTRLQPKDRIGATMGYALALNDTLTISTSLSGLYTFESRFDEATLRANDLFSLQFGLTTWLAEGLYIEPTVSFGLNGPGDSFVLGVTVPYTF